MSKPSTSAMEDIDVLAEAQKLKFDLGNLPDVEKMPTLPDIRKTADLDLAVNAEGRVYVFFEGSPPEPVEYVIYSIDDSTLTFISNSGRLQDIGMTVHSPMRKYMRNAKEIHLISFKDNIPTEVSTVPMVVHNIGL